MIDFLNPYIVFTGLKFKDIEDAIEETFRENGISTALNSILIKRIRYLLEYSVSKYTNQKIDDITIDYLNEIEVKAIISNLSFWLDGISTVLYAYGLITMEQYNNINQWIVDHLPVAVEH